MINPIVRLMIFSIVVFIGTIGCKSSFVIENVNFAQPVESVLEPDGQNMVSDQRYAVSFSVTPLLAREELESIENIHLIRDRDGYYYITAPGFSTVYVFLAKEGTLETENDIILPNGPASTPAFNQRGDHIELVDLTSGNIFRFNREGLIEEEEEES